MTMGKFDRIAAEVEAIELARAEAENPRPPEDEVVRRMQAAFARRLRDEAAKKLLGF